jgi:Tol biopolymer transport system component
MQRRRLVVAAMAAWGLAAVAGAWNSEALAGKPPSGGGGGGTPTDPAIAYATSTNSPGDLMVMNADGTNKTVVVKGALKHGGSINSQPDWSPDGSRIVFVGSSDGPGIYVVNRDGTGRSKIATLASAVGEGMPAWSPAPVPGIGGGRQRIAFSVLGPGQQNDVWIADVDGSNPVNVTGTTYPESEFLPTWSPDGTKLVCQVFGATRDRYGLMDFATGQYSVIAYPAPLAGHYVRRPSWSKTRSDRMVVEADVAGSGAMDLWLLDPLDAAFAPVNLTNTSAYGELSPSWSPDDARLVFAGNVAGRGIEVMDADGANRLVLSTSGIQPAWRRNP